MARKTKSISISLPTDLITKLKDLADNDERSLSGYIRLALTLHVEGMQKKPRKVQTEQQGIVRPRRKTLLKTV